MSYNSEHTLLRSGLPGHSLRRVYHSHKVHRRTIHPETSAKVAGVPRVEGLEDSRLQFRCHLALRPLQDCSNHPVLQRIGPAFPPTVQIRPLLQIRDSEAITGLQIDSSRTPSLHLKNESHPDRRFVNPEYPAWPSQARLANRIPVEKLEPESALQAFRTSLKIFAYQSMRFGSQTMA